VREGEYDMSIRQRTVRYVLAADYTCLRALVWLMNAIDAGESCRPLRNAALVALDAIGRQHRWISRMIRSLAPPIESTDPPPKSWTFAEAIEAIDAARRAGQVDQ
jgi:hypothetical protein